MMEPATLTVLVLLLVLLVLVLVEISFSSTLVLVLVLMLVLVLVLMVLPLLLLPWDGMFQLASSDGTVLGFNHGFCRVRVSITSDGGACRRFGFCSVKRYLFAARTDELLPLSRMPALA
jgi:hypothetical protein